MIDTINRIETTEFCSIQNCTSLQKFNAQAHVKNIIFHLHVTTSVVDIINAHLVANVQRHEENIYTATHLD